MHIFLDDVREAPEGWVKCTRPVDVILFLMRYNTDGFEVQELSLDHDLGTDACDGYDVLKWMEVYINVCPSFRPPRMYVHSANPAVYEKMRKSIQYIYRNTGMTIPDDVSFRN